MPKLTKKYSGALFIFTCSDIPTEGVNKDNQEELYTHLQQNGFFWDSKSKKWEEHDPNDAEEPTLLVRLRVWADVEITEDIADDIAEALKRYKRTSKWRLVQRSKPYLCRPPKQREAKIYIDFLPQ